MSELVVMPKADWQAALDATRAKTGKTDLIKSGDLAGEIESISAGGGEEEVNLAKAIIERTITEISDDTIETVGDYAFSGCKTLTSANFPNVTWVGNQVFGNCSSLKTVSLPKVTTFDRGYTFQYTALEAIDFPELTTALGSYVFLNCTSLRNVNLPKLKQAGGQFFANCLFESVVFPALENFNSQFLWDCKKLKLADFPVLGTIQRNGFYNCPLLDVVILRKTDGICTLVNVSGFTGTPFASGGTGGTVYVPQALITEYQNATNWSTLYTGGTCNFVAIEGSEYE